MKSLIPSGLLLAAAIAVSPATAAPAKDVGCAAIAAQLRQKTVEFVKVNADGRITTQPADAGPADFYRSLGKRDAALQTIASDVWAMRAHMASRNCSQAAAFSY